ncbi:MAG: DNA internalization-related competence protein ComEC/Rec2 [Thermoanaerobaculia bacterium]
MRTTSAPAVLPVALLLASAFAAGELVPAPVGLLAVGLALSAALAGRAGASLAALFLGLLCARLQLPPALAGLDLDRPVEVLGSVSGDWRPEAGGASAPFAPETVRQGTRLWTESPPTRLEIGAIRELPEPGSRLRVRGYFGRSPGLANAHAIPPGALYLRVKSAQLMTSERPPPWAYELLNGLRARVEKPLASSAARHPGVAYARALLLGDLDSVPAREQLGFRRAGLAHLLAVSGMNVALVAAVAGALASYCRRRTRFLVVAAAVLLHLALVGPAPSLLRATLMAAAVLGGRVFERPAFALQTLAVAAGIMVIFDPGLVRNLGFALSCSATFGLIVLAPRCLKGWPRAKAPWANALAVSWSAQAATLPWVLAAFSSLSPAATLINLIAVPLAGLLLVGALGWIALALVLPTFPALPDVAATLLDLIAWPYRWLPHLPTGLWLTLPLPPSWWLGVILGSAAIFAVRNPGTMRASVLLVLLSTASPAARADSAAGIEWIVADVGQGDGALLIRGRRAMLVDGGGSWGPHRGRDLAAQVWLPLLAARGIARIDVAVVSHGDSDHCGGLVDVASYIPIDEVWAAPELHGSGCVREILELSGARFRGFVAGDRTTFAGLAFAVLGPPRAGASGDNDRSLVLGVAALGRRLLLTGDIERAGENALLSVDRSALRCDILKVPHHGGRSSSGAELLAATGSRLATISCGVRNRFGHPAIEVLERLRRAGDRSLRTDLSGEIVLRWSASSPLSISFPGSPRAVLGDPSE